jgi:hypothetical protein
MLNTGIEKGVNFITAEENPAIGSAKHPWAGLVSY